jgi:hypothetical protein
MMKLNSKLNLNKMNKEEEERLIYAVKKGGPYSILLEMERIFPIRIISWCVKDFEQKASEIEENAGKKIFDRSKFLDALSEMIAKHDCNFGISWDTVECYLYENCKLD